MPPSLVSFNLNIDCNELLSRAWKKFTDMVGKADHPERVKQWLEDHTRMAFEEARFVQCIGMLSPVLISDIYQPTRLVREFTQTVTTSPEGGRGWDESRSRILSINDFIKMRQNCVVTAGPGWGKTTFLHWLFLRFSLETEDSLPLLVTLRKNDAVQDLEFITGDIENIILGNSTQRIVLLVDGYDEVSTETRQQVSALLEKFAIRKRGNYVLTCRDYYEIFDLKVPRLRIHEFDEKDQTKFASAFLRACGSSADPVRAVRDLHERGLSDLIRHPLLLTLATIVKSETPDFQPQNAASLIDAAINTLALRWDKSKGLSREPATPLSSTNHLKFLKRLAFTCDLEPIPQYRAVGIVGRPLNLRQDELEPLKVLFEMAQFYGIFVPIGDRWGFVHRSLQDFLAAQYWVETGKFAEALSKRELKFDSRTAFAGCLVEDGTAVIELALRQPDGLPVVVEMLRNDAAFDHERAANAIIAFYGRYRGQHYYVRSREKIECAVEQEFITEANPKFLDYIVRSCAPSREKTKDTLAAYAISELHRRRIPLSRAAYELCRSNYAYDDFVLDIRDRDWLRFKDIAHQ